MHFYLLDLAMLLPRGHLTMSEAIFSCQNRIQLASRGCRPAMPHNRNHRVWIEKSKPSRYYGVFMFHSLNAFCEARMLLSSPIPNPLLPCREALTVGKLLALGVTISRVQSGKRVGGCVTISHPLVGPF